VLPGSACCATPAILVVTSGAVGTAVTTFCLAGDPTDRLPRELAAAHVSVLPAVEESFGLVLAESLAAGTPVVAARSGAGPEIVTDDVGRLFEPDDRDSLVEALDQALTLADGGREACREHARRWDWSEVGPRYERLLERAREAR